MIEMKLIGRLEPRFEDPLFEAVLHLPWGSSVGQGHIVAPSLQLSAEVQHRFSRAGPFPVAEEMKDLQEGFPCLPLAFRSWRAKKD